MEIIRSMLMICFQKIKELCHKKSISFNRLEKECGLTRQIIEKWQTSEPSALKLAKVADYFDVSVDYLLGRTENPKVNY